MVLKLRLKNRNCVCLLEVLTLVSDHFWILLEICKKWRMALINVVRCFAGWKPQFASEKLVLYPRGGGSESNSGG
jgi:hypothetical protein